MRRWDRRWDNLLVFLLVPYFWDIGFGFRYQLRCELVRGYEWSFWVSFLLLCFCPQSMYVWCPRNIIEYHWLYSPKILMLIDVCVSIWSNWSWDSNPLLLWHAYCFISTRVHSNTYCPSQYLAWYFCIYISHIYLSIPNSYVLRHSWHIINDSKTRSLTRFYLQTFSTSSKTSKLGQDKLTTCTQPSTYTRPPSKFSSFNLRIASIPNSSNTLFLVSQHYFNPKNGRKL